MGNSALKEDHSSPYNIQIKNVRRIYKINTKSNKKEKNLFTAIDNFNLDVKYGEFLTIVGPSGCGKSTLLDLISGLAFPDEGSISIDGKEITGPDLDRGFVMQGYALFPWRTVTQNIQFGLEIQKVEKKERQRIAQGFIELVGLAGFENRFPYELSGGMKQRVAIARALAYNPKVLLMDEPFAAVDAQTRELLQEELLRIWETTHKTIVFITHSIDEAVFLAQRVAVMSSNPGRIKEVIDVDLPTPRKSGDIKVSPDFNWIVHKVWKSLHNEEDNPVKTSGKHNLEEEIDPNTVI